MPAFRLMPDEGRDESETNPSGGGTPERLFESPFALWPTSWWPGLYLVTYNEQSKSPGGQVGYDLYLLDRESQLRPLATSPFNEMEGQLTPDS